MIPVLVPKMPSVQAIAKYMERAESARWWSNNGQLVRELEQRLARHYGAFVVTVASCTAGLELVYRLRKLQGMESIKLPSYTFPATVLAALAAGLKVELEDVHPRSWTHSAVAGFGLPEDGTTLDAAAAWGEQRVYHGQIAVFSLHATKPLGAGEGGYIVTHDHWEAQLLREMANFGMNGTGQPSRGWGNNSKMSELHAAAALAALDQWSREPWLQLYEWYDEHLVNIDGVYGQGRRRLGVYPVMPVKLDVPAEPVQQYMASCGIETRRWYNPPMHEHPCSLGDSDDFPFTNELVEHLIGLPWHLHLDKSHVIEVCDVLQVAIARAKLVRRYG